MNVMKQALLTGVISLMMGALFLWNAPQADAAYLKFDKATVTTQANQTFTVDVIVDAGTDQITSTDIWVLYDPTALEAQLVTNGTFFSAVTNNLSSGKVSITALIVEPGTYKTGAGTVATITFKALKDGTTDLTFDCRTDVSNSSKIIKNDVNATNIIACSQNVKTTVTVGAGGASSSSTSSYTPPASQTTPATLPQTGVFEHVAKFAAPGLLLLAAGIMLRFVL